MPKIYIKLKYAKKCHKNAKSRQYSISQQNSVKFGKNFTRDRILYMNIVCTFVSFCISAGGVASGRVCPAACAAGLFLSYDTKIAQSFLYVSGNLQHVFENLLICTNFWSLSGNSKRVSRNFDRTKEIYLFSIIWHNKFQDCLKFPACVRKFWACVRKIPDF